MKKFYESEPKLEYAGSAVCVTLPVPGEENTKLN